MLQGDVADSDDNGYKAAAKAASHPNPEAYCEFVMQLDLGILRAGSGSGRAKKSPVFFLAARARPDPVAGP